MLEGAIVSLVGSALGGIARLAPEMMKLWDRKNERKHELSMFEKNLEFEKLKGEQAAGSEERQLDMAELKAIMESFKTQVPTGNIVVDAYNSSVRPTVTYVFLALYAFTKWAAYSLNMAETGSRAEAVLKVWGPEDYMIFSGIIGYWFVDRTLRKMRWGQD